MSLTALKLSLYRFDAHSGSPEPRVLDETAQPNNWGLDVALDQTQLSAEDNVNRLQLRAVDPIAFSQKLQQTYADFLRIGPLPLPQGLDWAYAGGWQCWSDSPLLNPDGILLPDPDKERWPFGDVSFYPYAQKPGCFHSWFVSYGGCESRPGQHAVFVANTQKKLATAFVFDLRAEKFSLDIDISGVHLSRDRQPLSLGAFLYSNELTNRLGLSTLIEKCTDTNHRVQFSQPTKAQTEHAKRDLFATSDRVLGYTSWYHHYQNISCQLLQKNLEASPPQLQIFQIDDGYQAEQGAWQTVSDRFGRLCELEELLSAVAAKGQVPGVWMAPFVAPQKSALFTHHPELFLRDTSGNLVKCGHIPHWGGDFFALDTEAPSLWKKIEEDIDFWVNRGVLFFKCDFLYGAGVIPSGGRTRLERACRAHDRLYSLIRSRDARFLSCGAIFEQAAFSCDASRVGADVGRNWWGEEHESIWSRERVSSRSCLNNTITRSPFNGTLFLNDGDVSILRSQETDLSREERELLAQVNGALSHIQFISCDMFAWKDEQDALFATLSTTQRLQRIRHIEAQFSEGREADEKQRLLHGRAHHFRLLADDDRGGSLQCELK